MEKENQTLDFKPLTSGLGFHPFSDGLPYAPVSQAPKSSGTGAVSAGRPTFVSQLPPGMPQRTAARVSVPVTANARASIARPSEPQMEKRTEATIAEPTFGFGYLFKRLLAYTIDSAINSALVLTALSFALVNEEAQPDLLMNPGVILVSSLFLVLFNWALITAQEVAFGTSIGKRMFRLALHGSTSAIFLRSFFFLPSAGFLGAGLLWSVIDRKKRCWHDLIVDLQPSEIARL